jgi:hypothetical protein
MKAKYTYKATLKPRAAKKNANDAIAKSLTNTHEDNVAAVKIRQDDKHKLISLFYVHIGAPLPEDWHGEGGTISRIVGALEMTAEERRKVETVISETYQSLRREEVFDKGRISQKNKTAIADGSKIQQLLADYQEIGLSYSKTAFLINIYCIENDLLTVTCSAVVSCEQRMEKVVTSIAKRPQGSLDKNTTWAKCCHCWVARLLIRLGCTINLDPFLEEANNFLVPPCFHCSCLTPLDMCAIGWWDETHKKCFFGDFREGQAEQVRFYQNENQRTLPPNCWR